MDYGKLITTDQSIYNEIKSMSISQRVISQNLLIPKDFHGEKFLFHLHSKKYKDLSNMAKFLAY